MPEKQKRQLAAILFADIVGYTALMQKGEAYAMATLNRYLKVTANLVAKNNGEIIKSYGDGSLILFSSTVDAVQCAHDIQLELQQAPNVPLRIGIHVGEVVRQGEDIFGNGVNIASRIESMGTAGAVLLSKDAQAKIKNQESLQTTSLGSFEFKNVEEPLEVFALANAGLAIPQRKSLKGKLQEKKNSPLMLAAAAALLLLLGFVLYSAFTKEVIKGAKTIPRLAVMLFDNEGEGYSMNDYFATGITEELNSRLSGLKQLAVISRSSAKMYADSDLSAKEIGTKLGADYILEGTVRWRRDETGPMEVRITPRLVRVTDDTQIWSPHYDRIFDKAIDLQTLIASDLIKELNLALSTEEQFQLEEKPTNNPLAYEAWLRGLKVMPDGHGSQEGYQKAYKMFKQAITIDPGFARAWISLGEAHGGFYWFGYDTDKSRLDSALICIEKAAEIDPDLDEVALGRANYYYRQRNYDKALLAYSKLLEERPNDSQVLRNIAIVWRRQGLIAQAVETMEKASVLDPLNVMTNVAMAWTYLFLKDFEKAIRKREKALELDPKGEWNYLMGAFIYWCRDQENDLQLAHELLEHVPVAESSYPAWFWITQHWFAGDPQSALNKIKNLSVPAIELQHSYLPQSLLAASTYKMLGDEMKAKQGFETALAQLKSELEKTPNDFRIHIALGKAYAGLGMHDEAMMAAKKGVELLPLSKDALMGLDALMGQMQVYAMLGEDELALDVMAKMFSVPCVYGGMFFTKNPVFSSLQTNPRFVDLLERNASAPTEEVFLD